MKSDLDRHLDRHLKGKEFKLYFDRADAKRKIAQEIASLRKSRNITQAHLAKEVKTRQQVISRLGNPADTRMPSFEFLDRIAGKFNKRMVLCFE
jgi:hypothetical protein